MGLLSFISEFKHKSEMRESQDEMLIGEIVYLMSQRGWPLVGLQSGGDLQYIQFRTLQDPILHKVQFRLDRKTGTGAVSQALIGSKATLRVICEVKNLLADPDDLLNQWATDLKNIVKIPMLGQVKINHEFNSIFAEKATIIEIGDYVLKGDAGRGALQEFLTVQIDECTEKLAPYKKGDAGIEI